MKTIKLLIVEDNEDDLNTLTDSAETYKNNMKDRGIDLDFEISPFKSVDVAIQKMDSAYDGAVVDLKFSESPDYGKKVLDKIKDNFLRIPVIILTGTPANIDTDKYDLIDFLKKGSADFEKDIFGVFHEIYNTGLTEILGGRGHIEEYLMNVFSSNILPQIKQWRDYSNKDSDKTKQSLLRYILNHIVDLLVHEDGECYPEEVYISPLQSENLKTGSIVNEKERKGEHYIVLNPPCDLAITKKGCYKSDRILLVYIEKTEGVIDGYRELKEVKSEDSRKRKLKNLISNNYTYYYHFLPFSCIYEGGFINFRKIKSLPGKKLFRNYESTNVQVTPEFIKDILSRFSAYYARQGQPEIYNEEIMKNLIDYINE